ncbi:MAG: hypothetical protein HY652_10080 [Acidobacteria bacterium]|nr:hypothetical protein [Acidobacteriota bacterium]
MVEKGRRDAPDQGLVRGDEQMLAQGRIVRHGISGVRGGRGGAEVVDGSEKVGQREEAIRAAAKHRLHDGAVIPARLAVVEFGAVGHDPLNGLIQIVETERGRELRHYRPRQFQNDVRHPALRPGIADVSLPGVSLLSRVVGKDRHRQDFLLRLAETVVAGVRQDGQEL